MTAALTPAAALARIAILTADLRGAAVLDGRGTAVAGDPDVAAMAGKALLTMGSRMEVHTADGLHLVRAGDRAVAAHAGPQALSGLLLADLREALAQLAAA